MGEKEATRCANARQILRTYPTRAGSLASAVFSVFKHVEVPVLRITTSADDKIDRLLHGTKIHPPQRRTRDP